MRDDDLEERPPRKYHPDLVAFDIFAGRMTVFGHEMPMTERLLKASPFQRRSWHAREVDGIVLGVRWEELDEDIALVPCGEVAHG